MRVPLLDLPRQHAPFREALHGAIARVVDSGRYILGPEVEAFEAELAAAADLPFAVGLSSGTDALLAALMALGVGPGDEVITTTYSFFATAGAIARLGATPVFADVGDDLNLDPVAALARVGPRTRAVIPVDLFGRRAETAPYRQPGLPVIEDAAQALGAPSVGHDVALATLSFFPSKNLGALGDAGAVITADPDLARRLRLLRAHGAQPKYTHHLVGGNFRLDALQAAALRIKLPHLAPWNAARRANAARYGEAFADLPALALPSAPPGHIFHHFVLRTPRRDALLAHLKERGIESEVYYPLPLHLQPCFAYLGGRPGDLPRAEAASRDSLAIPVHPELTAEQLDYVIDTIRAFCRSRA